MTEARVMPPPAAGGGVPAGSRRESPGRPCPLQQPGILLQMIAPADDSHPTAVAAAPGATAGVRQAAMVGAALAAFGLAAVAGERAWLPFAAVGERGWLLAVAAAALGAGAVRWFGNGPLPALGGLVAIAAAALLLGWIGVAAAGSALVLAALSLGGLLAAAVPAGQRALAGAAGIGAAVLAGAWWLVGAAAAAEALLAAALVLQLVAWCAMAAPLPAPIARGARSLRFAVWRPLLPACGLVVLALLLLPNLAAVGDGRATLSAVALALVAIAAVAAVRLASVAAAGLLLAIAWFAPGPGAGAEPQLRLLATAGANSVHYDRSNQELQLRCGADLIEAVGPERCEAALVATLLQAFAAPGDRVALLGPVAGATAALLRSSPRWELEVVDARPASRPLQPWLCGAGPVLPPASPAAPAAMPVRTTGLSAAMQALPDASRQAVVVAEPNGAPWSAGAAGARSLAAHGEWQQQLRRVVGPGLVLQVFALDRTPAAVLAPALAAAAAAHPWCGLFVVGDAAVMVGAATAPDWPRLAPLAQWSVDARWTAHQAHLGDLDDLQRALLGRLRPVAPAAVAPDAQGRRAAVEVLHAHVEPAVALPPAADSVLLRWTAARAELRAAVQRLRELGDSEADRALAQDLAAKWLPQGAPAAALQAALGLAGAGREPLLTAAAASRRAHAIDPTLFVAPPPVLRSLPLPSQFAGELEDLATLPSRPRLAELVQGDAPLAVALRTRFPSAAARALVEAAALGALPFHGQQALRELADPFVLREVAAALLARGAARELLAIWRHDLPMPAALTSLLAGSPDDRRALAAALRGRREPSCHGALATLLEAAEPELRLLAAEALWDAVGDRVPYDPDWPQSARAAAAERLRALHNRLP